MKKRVAELMRSGTLGSMLCEFESHPARKVINALYPHLCSGNDGIRWAAIKAMGVSIARLAAENEESARIIMRRFIWNLNEESGGAAWGAPESMAEAMALHEGLAEKFAHVLVSFIMPDGLYLDFEPLLRGAVWGIGRLAEKEPDRVGDAVEYLIPFLSAADAGLRGMSARALGLLNARGAVRELEGLAGDKSETTFFLGRELVTKEVGELASEALSAIGSRREGQ